MWCVVFYCFCNCIDVCWCGVVVVVYQVQQVVLCEVVDYVGYLFGCFVVFVECVGQVGVWVGVDVVVGYVCQGLDVWLQVGSVECVVQFY